MRVGQTLEGVTSTSSASSRHARSLPRATRAPVLVRAGHEAPKAKTSLNGRSAVRLPPSQAVALPMSEQAPTTAPSRPEPASAGGLTGRLQSWLPWATAAIPLASQTVPGASLDPDAALFGDGMATATAPPSPGTPAPRRGWSVLSRSSNASTAATAPPGPEHRPVQVDHAALQVLRQRVLEGSRPGARADGFKLGLVVEGGGMRGCVSGGALQALSDLGVRECFDAVYGSSAGAINGSFFLAGQLDAVNIYHDHIASEEFINLRRLLSRKPDLPPALNLGFLLDHVMQSVFPLDFESVLASPIPLKVVASSLDALSPVLMSDFEDRHDLITALRASATVPEVAGGPVHHRGHRLVDAAVFEAVPFRSAIADGCTHVLVLATRPPPVRKSLIDQALADAVEAAVKRAVLSPDYMVPAWRAEVETLVKDGLSQDEMLLRSLDEDAADLPWFAGSHVYPIYPAGRCPSPVCTDVGLLKAGVAEGRRSVMTVMRAILGDTLDFSRFLHESGQIVPMRRTRGAAADADKPRTRVEADVVQTV